MATMKKIIQWYGDLHEPVAEDPKETLTVHPLGLPHLLRRTFRVTNPIESLFDKVVYHPRRVESWKRGSRVARW